MYPYLICLIFYLSLTLAACNLGAPPTESTLDELATEVAGTLQARGSATSTLASLSATVSNTDTQGPPTATAPSPPIDVNLPAATRINFDIGTTQAVVSDAINAGDNRYYAAGAADGQVIFVLLSNPDQAAVLSVFGADGSILLGEGSQQTIWQGELPASQDYYFGVHASRDQDFTLSVIIAARVQYQTGQDTITFTGRTFNGFAVTYVAYAFDGQRLEVTLDTDPDDAALTIWGFEDGQPYARAQNGVTDFSMELPSTQDYIIEVMPQGGREINYKITIRIH